MLTRHTRKRAGVECTHLRTTAIADVHDAMANADTGRPQNARAAPSLDLRSRQIQNLSNFARRDVHHVDRAGISTGHPQAVRCPIEGDVVH